MAKQYYSVLTDYGTQVIAQAIAHKQPLQIMQMAVGDGNGQATTPSQRLTALVREVHRANVSAISVDPRNNKQIIFELTIPENVGGFWIREMGIFDHQNRLVAYANCPDSFKPQLESGSGKVQVVRMILLVSSSDAITLKVDDSVIFVTRSQFTPKKITATTKNAVEETGHSHEIDKASTSQAGIVQLTNATDSEAETLGLTAKAGKTLKGLIDALTRNLSNYIPNSKKSDAVTSPSSDTIATSFAVKTAYDKAVEADNHAERAYHLAESKQSPATTLAGYGIGDFKVGTSTGDANDCKIDGNYYFASGQNLPSAGEWHIAVMSGGQPNAIRQIARKANESKVQTRYFNGTSWSAWKEVGGDGVPVGSVVAFPSAVQNPQGFLKCDGSTFGRTTYPDLYRALGNSDKLPDLRRSDVGMTAYFATDNIPEGWIAFDDIEEQVSEQAYPELYRHLVEKYGSLSAVPKAKDRFIRNAGALLAVGEVQQDALQDHFHYIPTEAGGDYQAEKDITIVIRDSDTTNVVPGAFKPAQKGRVQANNTAVADGARAKTYLASTKDTTEKDTRTAEETRPKSLVLKLCIKAQNTLDGVQFWIKAFGNVSNAGELEVSRLAQDMQQVRLEKADISHTHTASEITDLKLLIKESIARSISNKSVIGGFKVMKYPDGTMIQTYCFNQNDIVGTREKSFMWPEAFIDIPLIFASVATSVNTSHDCGINILTKSNKSQCFYYEYEHGTLNQGAMRIQFLAIGRWKTSRRSRDCTCTRSIRGTGKLF
ncbi:phage tail protein [Avibacterium paragallinarum]|uniref:phage tail-collar fiber domain-containing protein n=1 Tax=Avibacterium paragallinarum TaxID=728 RepID=UPI00397DF48F